MFNHNSKPTLATGGEPRPQLSMAKHSHVLAAQGIGNATSGHGHKVWNPKDNTANMRVRTRKEGNSIKVLTDPL